MIWRLARFFIHPLFAGKPAEAGFDRRSVRAHLARDYFLGETPHGAFQSAEKVPSGFPEWTCSPIVPDPPAP
jgi:hypothetical protein